LNELKRAKDEALAPIEDFKKETQLAIERVRKEANQEFQLNHEKKDQTANQSEVAANAEDEKNEKPS